MSNKTNAQCPMRNAKSSLWKMLLSTLPLMAVVTLLLMMDSCEHKELSLGVQRVRNVRVAFDWSNAPEANPAGMCVFFYPDEGTRGGVQRIDYTGRDGGAIDLYPGSYHIVAYNNDTESILFGGQDDFFNHIGYTREGGILEPVFGASAQKAPGVDETGDQLVVISPDMLWGGSLTSHYVDDDDHVITIYPEELVCHYTFEVRNVTNIEHMVQTSGILTSMSPFVTFNDKSLGEEGVTIPFAASRSQDNRLTGEFLTFGHHESNRERHNMLFYIWLDDGSKWYYTYDVTNQVDNAPNPRRVHIVIDGLDLPTPIVDSGGFAPSVDGFDSENFDIPM
ncbi:MAG: DUF5119 domain-containing protein [Muribaculum sp.]|nr:DUF5119 domain-containing protein [Muribaculum sp.]